MNAEQAYELALLHLKGLAAQKDFSPEGDRAFFLAREDVYWKKCALISAHLKKGKSS